MKQSLEIARSAIPMAFGVGIIATVTMAAWRYVIVPYRTPPAKPVFANESKSPPAKHPLAAYFKPQEPPKLQVKAAPKPTASPALYQGVVSADIGLVLRAEPDRESPPVGGADYNAEVSVLKESPDGEWVYIRQEDTKEEGWVRAGNLVRN